MSQRMIDILKAQGAMSADKTLMKAGEHDLTMGVPVIDVPRRESVGGEADFVIYDSVTSPDGRTLIQGHGNAYHGMVLEGDKLRFEVQKIEANHQFGVIGFYPKDYFLANRQFVDDLRRRLG